MSGGAWLYILRCADGSYYVGTTRTSLEIRIAQHNDGTFEGYTASRRPVQLVFSQWFDRITDAIESERKLKGWSRAKKEALIRGDFGKAQVTSPSETPPSGGLSARWFETRDGQRKRCRRAPHHEGARAPPLSRASPTLAPPHPAL